MNYLVDGPRKLEKDPAQIKESKLPVIFAFHGMYLSGESLIQTDHYQKKSLRSHNRSGNLSEETSEETSRNDYVVIAVNRAGYRGSSGVKPEKYSYKEFTLDVGEIADSLDIHRFGVVGHSSGGPNALACAAILGPDRVGAFATLGSDPEYFKFDDIPYDCAMDCCIGVWLPRVLGVCLPCLRVANGMRNDYVLERRAYPFECELIEQHGVVIAGEEDRMLPGWLTKRVTDRLPHAKYKVVPGAGHEDLLRDEHLDAAYRTVIELMSVDCESDKKEDLPITKLIREKKI